MQAGGCWSSRAMSNTIKGQTKLESSSSSSNLEYKSGNICRLTEVQLIARHFNWLELTKNTNRENSYFSSAHDGFELPPTDVQAAIRHSLSPNTVRAYASDIEKFRRWGGTIPSSPVDVATFVTIIAKDHKVASITRMLVAISKAHRASGFDDPCKSEMVKSTMRGIRRMIGTAQHAAKPIMKEDLFSVLECMGSAANDVRDKALLLIGFAGAFRRSELVSLDVEDIDHVRQGIVVTLRTSKTDQEGKGRKIGIPFGRTKWCPVQHLAEWLSLARIASGPIFLSIAKGGRIASSRLSAEAVCLVVKRRMQSAGYDAAGYSGHSLRAGFATSAASAGANSQKIRAQTGHASDAMLSRYIRDGDLFNNNASGCVL
jgi:integrase